MERLYSKKGDPWAAFLKCEYSNNYSAANSTLRLMKFVKSAPDSIF